MIETSHQPNLWPSLLEPFRHFGHKLSQWFSPASDGSTDQKSYRIQIEVPGVTEDDIQLTLADGALFVKGEKRAERESESEGWYFKERQFGMFQRVFRLPADAQTDGIEADLKGGVLTILIPRSETSATHQKQVKIRRG